MKNLLFIFIIIFLSSCGTQQGCKNYIISHQQEIIKTDHNNNNNNYFSIPGYSGFYYKHITIKTTSDSSYTIILKGDKNSFLWKTKQDKYMVTDIANKRFLGIATKKDYEVFNIINQLKK